jgi:hypothetical protein
VVVVTVGAKTTLVLVLSVASALGAVTVVFEEEMTPPLVVVFVVIFVELSADVVVTDTDVTLFSTTVVAFVVRTPAVLDKVMVVVTDFPSGLVTSVEFAPVTFLMETPCLPTVVTVSTSVPLMVTTSTSEVDLSVEFVTVMFVVVVVVCPWASPRVSARRAALTKLMACPR